jgi:L-threonylcarbamoyladenylate synthase
VERVAVSAEDPDAPVLERAVALLRAGRLLIYPTDTLYALGGCALDERSARAVRLAKTRLENKALPLVAADLAQVRALTAAFPPLAEALAERFWPGPLSLVLAASASVPEAVHAGLGTVAVRVPALELTRLLCARAGPLISTSANRSGEEAPTACATAMEAVGEAAALALDAGPSASAVASTIVEVGARGVRLVRAGAVPWRVVQEVAAGVAC